MNGHTIPAMIRMWIVGKYYELYACPRGKHVFKMSGCMYCGK